MSDENLPPRRRVIRDTEDRKSSLPNSRFRSPRRLRSNGKKQAGESTAKKNHSSSSQVNNYSRDEHKDSGKKIKTVIGKNIHMRETFKCGEDSVYQQERLGFSFLYAQKQAEKESLALWKNVSMPLTSPSKVKPSSRSQNKENKFTTSYSRQLPSSHNPFNDSRESQDNRINSSKTKLMTFVRSPDESMNFLSHENNLSSITNHKLKPASQNIHQSQRPIWQNSPITNFGPVQSFRSEVHPSFEKSKIQKSLKHN